MEILKQSLDDGCVCSVGASCAGIRADNEDAMLIRPDLGLYAVCDGMGGHGHGDIAAEHAIEGVLRAISAETEDDPSARVRAAVAEAGLAVRRAGEAVSPDDPIGTTLTMALIANGSLHCGHVGDSRLYRLRDGQLEQLTIDHNLAHELRKYGTTNARMLRAYEGVLTRYLGSDKHCDGDFFCCELRQGDRYLLSSDGLDVVPRESLQASLGHALEDVPQLLMAKAKHFNSLDNITVLALAVE